MKYYNDKCVACPFYTYESGSKIFCEGFTNHNYLQTSFENREWLMAHKRRYCRRIADYKDCPLYSIIIAKYKED